MPVIIFDLDGTLVDSLDQIAVSMNRARSQRGFATADVEYYSSVVGMPAEELVADLGLMESDVRLLIDDFRSILQESIRFGNRVFPGVLEALECLIQHNFNLGIATNKPTSIAAEVLKYSDLSQIDFFLQGTTDTPPKPHPFAIQQVLNYFNDTSALMIGDRTEDVVAASNAGIPAIGISASGHSLETLKKSGAQSVYGSFIEFSQALVQAENVFTFLHLDSISHNQKSS